MNYRETLLGEGYFLYKGLLSKEEAAEVKARVGYIAKNAKHYQDQGVSMMEDPKAPKDATPMQRFYRIDGLGYADPFIWDKVVTHPNMLKLVQAVLGPDYVAVNGGGFFFKPAFHGSHIPWHQDSAVWTLPPCPYEPNTTPLIFDYWMAFDHATKENGCLQLIPGSQNIGRVPHAEKSLPFPEIDITEYGFSKNDAKYFEMEPGDILVWHQDMFHYSDPNTSPDARLGMVGTFMAANDVPWFRNLLPDHPRLEKLPICLNGEAQALPEAFRVTHPQEGLAPV